MAKWLVVVESNCADPAREREFNEWYDKTHVPDVLETPGVVRATRYQLMDPPAGAAKYMAAYEVEADDLQKTMKAMGENMEKWKAKGRVSDLLRIASIRSYRVI